MDNQLFIKVKGLPVIEIDRNILADDTFEVDFGGSYKLQITNENGTFVITNAMNGYGDNCYEQFKGEQVSFLDYFDYAMSISNQNAQPELPPSPLQTDARVWVEPYDAERKVWIERIATDLPQADSVSEFSIDVCGVKEDGSMVICFFDFENHCWLQKSNGNAIPPPVYYLVPVQPPTDTTKVFSVEDMEGFVEWAFGNCFYENLHGNRKWYCIKEEKYCTNGKELLEVFSKSTTF